MSLNPSATVDDLDIADALSAFVARIAAGAVSVTFWSGVASLNGCVKTEAARTAIEDLVRAHEGVRCVVSALTIASAEAASPHPAG
jgi:osmotically-inducible protein OsmY